jgi:hypothetical protein
MIEEGFLAGHPADDFPKAFGLGEVTKEHGNKLVPATNPPGMSFSRVLLDGFFKFISRKQT